MSGVDQVTAATPPWLHVTDDAAALGAAVRAVDAAGGSVRRLSGSRMRRLDDLFTELSDRLSFPGYFGRTWDGVQDCLTDLAWLPAGSYLLVVDRADRVLDRADPRLLALFGSVLDRAARFWSQPIALGEAWDRPPVPFHVVLRVPGSAPDGSSANESAANESGANESGANESGVGAVARRWARSGADIAVLASM